MSEFIQANYEQLTQLAQRFQVHAEAIETLKGKVQTSTEALANGGWEGQGSQQFQQEMAQEIYPATGRLKEALAEANRVTLLIVHIVQAAEEEAAAPFRGGQPAIGPGGGQVNGGGASVGSGRESFLFGTIELSDRPKPPANLSTAEKLLVTGLGVVAVGADVLSTFISGAGVVLEGGGTVIDGPSPVGEGVALAAYYVALKPYETAISLVGIGATGLSDIVQGNTFISGTELVIGQDTLVAGGAFVGSLPLEGIGSTAVNLGMLGYDAASLFGYSPSIAGHRWELRIETGEIPPRTFFVGYPSGN